MLFRLTFIPIFAPSTVTPDFNPTLSGPAIAPSDDIRNSHTVANYSFRDALIDLAINLFWQLDDTDCDWNGVAPVDEIATTGYIVQQTLLTSVCGRFLTPYR